MRDNILIKDYSNLHPTVIVLYNQSVRRNSTWIIHFSGFFSGFRFPNLEANWAVDGAGRWKTQFQKCKPSINGRYAATFLSFSGKCKIRTNSKLDIRHMR